MSKEQNSERMDHALNTLNKLIFFLMGLVLLCFALFTMSKILPPIGPATTDELIASLAPLIVGVIGMGMIFVSALATSIDWPL